MIFLEAILNFDLAIFEFFKEVIRADWLNPIMKIITTLGIPHGSCTPVWVANRACVDIMRVDLRIEIWLLLRRSFVRMYGDE